MNVIVRSAQAFGIDLSLLVHFGDSHASAQLAFRGRAPQGQSLEACGVSDDDAVQGLTRQVDTLMERAYEQYRAARLCQWTAEFVSPVGRDVQLSVFDEWLLEKLMASCDRFQIAWTPFHDHPGAFRMMYDHSVLRLQVTALQGSGTLSALVVEVRDIQCLAAAVREFITEVLDVDTLTQAAD